MKANVPAFDHGQYINQITSLYSLRKFQSELSAKRKSEFRSFVQHIQSHLPLHPPKSEDQVLDLTLELLRSGGWEAKNRGSTFIPNTDFKPDIWMNGNDVYTEVLKLRTSGNASDWSTHCKRCLNYARHSTYQVAICTDGRRFFVVSTEDGDPKFAYIDLKRYDVESDEYMAICLLIWSHGPLFSASKRTELRRVSDLSKKLFKSHILKSISRLDDNYKEMFGLLCAAAYAHYNGSPVFETSRLLEAIYALSREHYDLASNLIKEFVKDLSNKNVPGISIVAARVAKLIGKNSKLDLSIFRSILIDDKDCPISWESFDSDDLSHIYEAVLKKKRQRHGIYTTPRDLCFPVIKAQLENGLDGFKGKKLALVDPCCGSGSFIDQSIRAIGKEFLPPQKRNRKSTIKELSFVGQDIQEMAVAISLVNAYVACLRYLWHLDNINIKILIGTGDTIDGRSPIYKTLKNLKPNYTIVFGNPPYLRSRSGKFGGTSNEGNFLFEVTEKAMALCSPGEIAFVLPANVKGGEAAETFDAIPKRFGLKLNELWHLPEVAIFNGVSEKRHIVAYWRQASRGTAKVLVLTPPKMKADESISSAIDRARTTKSLQFSTEESGLSTIPMYSNLHIPKDLKAELSKLPRLSKLKESRVLTIVQGVQEAHPFIPAAADGKGRPTRYAPVIKKHGYDEGAPLFVIPRKSLPILTASPRRPMTKTEKEFLKLHAKSNPTELRLEYPKSTNKVIFSNGVLGKLSEEDFKEQCPHFYSWLVPFYDLLMLDIDRKSEQIKWWQLQRSRDPKPTATIRPGVNFELPKLLVNQFMAGDFWSWADNAGHVAAGSNFNVIAPFPKSEKPRVLKVKNIGKHSKAQKPTKGSLELRPHWNIILAAWLNSHLIKQIWIKLFGNCRVRGVDGEVQLKKHLLNIPVPAELVIKSKSVRIEVLVKQIERIAIKCSTNAKHSNLVALDTLCWKLMEEINGKKIGRPATRDEGAVAFKPAA